MSNFAQIVAGFPAIYFSFETEEELNEIAQLDQLTVSGVGRY
jgi:hypothetical protein